MNKNKLEVYDPRKTIIEKVKPLLRPTVRIFVVLIIILVTISATKFILDNKGLDELDLENSNQIIIHTGNAFMDVSKKAGFEEKTGEVPKKVIENETDYSTLIEDLMRSKMIEDLPKGAILKLQFYNFDSGIRQWEKSYNLEKGSVKEGNENGDIQIIMDSKYIKDFKIKRICEVLTNAKNNGDFGVDTQMTQSALMWKYRGMLKYRECLGF